MAKVDLTEDEVYSRLRSVSNSRRRGKDSPSFMWGRNCHTFQVAQTCEPHKIKV